MTLMQTWRDSLLLFLPRQFKPFFLVTLKTIVHTYYILFSRLWWVVALDACMYYYVVHRMPTNLIVNPLYFFVSDHFLFFLILLAMRPSVLKKNKHYFLSYVLYFMPLLLFLLLVMAVVISITLLFFIFPYIFVVDALKTFFLVNGPFVISPLVIFFTLFLLDSDGSLAEVVKSVARSIKMVWYNYPFCLISFIFFCYLFFPLAMWMIDYISLVGYSIVTSLYGKLIVSFLARYLYFWICMPIAVSFIVNFYVKMIYPQMSLYFLVIKKDG